MGKESLAKKVPREVDYMKKKCIPKRKPMEEVVKHEPEAEMLKCPFERCEHSFPNEGTRRRHIQKQHQQYECQVCGNEQPSFAQHKRHMERHQQCNPLQCVYCWTAFEDRDALADHLKKEHVHNPDIEWQCDDCGMVFPGSKHVSRHRRLHLSDRMFACPECPMTFKTLYHMRRHHEIIHQDLRYQCTFCDKDYSRRDILRAHLEVAHNFQSYFYCSICLATFETDQDLQRHQERHRKPRTLECGTCLQEFLSEQELAQHLCITYRESYVCCGKDFRQHRLYNHHMLIRHGMKVNVRVQPPEGALLSQYRAMNKPNLLQCENCNERFEKKVALRHHVQVCRQQANAGNPFDMLCIELLGGDEQSEGSMEPTVNDTDCNERLEDDNLN
ncbi:PR domain zinc finger protein 5-like [Anopheles bellator]|uniref:PR domain zinc finger protein 5-like n=1 Tax=Anopheles bellator TaxID=139047 RepID=UPI0026476EE9|nr:PR domain zinc finger protein 5-like [Anopheles bellator]